MTAKRAFRSVAAIAVGIILISAVVEALELGLVTAVGGGFTRDPEAYYGVRNQPGFLAAKLVYNTLVAAGAGYLTAVIAGYEPLRHGLALAVIQTAAIGFFIVSQPEMAQWTPGWMWVLLIVFTFAGIVFGARQRARAATPPG